MAQNYVNKGMNLTYIIPSSTTITSGQLVAVGGTADDKVVGVALNSGTTGDKIEIATYGVWDVDKTTSQAMAQGTLVYFDPATNKATTAANTGGGSPVNHPKLGRVWETAASADTIVRVKIDIF